MKWKKGNFIGQEALLRLQNNPNKRSQHGVMLIENGVPRADCIVYKGGKAIGKLPPLTFALFTTGYRHCDG